MSKAGDLDNTEEAYKQGYLIKRGDGITVPDQSKGDIITLADDDPELPSLRRDPLKFQPLDGISPLPGQLAGTSAEVMALRAENERLRQQLLSEQQGHIAEVSSATSGSGGVTTKVKPNFDTMTAKQLQEWAAAEEIDLKGAKSHADILKILKAATS